MNIPENVKENPLLSIGMLLLFLSLLPSVAGAVMMELAGFHTHSGQGFPPPPVAFLWFTGFLLYATGIYPTIFHMKRHPEGLAKTTFFILALFLLFTYHLYYAREMLLKTLGI